MPPFSANFPSWGQVFSFKTQIRKKPWLQHFLIGIIKLHFYCCYQNQLKNFSSQLKNKNLTISCFLNDEYDQLSQYSRPLTQSVNTIEELEATYLQVKDKVNIATRSSQTAEVSFQG